MGFFRPLRPLPAESQPLDDFFFKKNVTHEKSALNLYSPGKTQVLPNFFLPRGEKGGLEEMCDVSFFFFTLGGWDVSNQFKSFLVPQ